MARNFLCVLRIAFLIAVWTATVPAHAESQFNTAAGAPTSASARLDFAVVVPKVLYLRVGTGTEYTSNAANNLISFVVPAAQLGNGTPLGATAVSGDLGNGTVTARVLGNNGDVTLTSNTLGPMGNGVGDIIAYSQITTTATALTTASVLPVVGLASGNTTTVTVPAVNGVVNRDARWNYTYANSAVVAPGTYGGVNVNNGRVTYTASMP